MRPTPWALASGVLALAAACAPAPPAPAPTIVLVSLDTTRADRIGAYGHAAADTPRLDALAGEGRLFTRAWTPAPITLPAHVSLLTGTWPCEHGVRDNSVFKVEDEARLVSEVLADAGWRCGAFVGAYVLDASFGVAQGFERFTSPVRTHAVQGPSIAERRADRVVDDALAWLAGPAPAGPEADEPVFLWAHFYDPHAPYAPPPPFDVHADPYDGEIAFADEQLGRLLDGVAARRDGPVLVIVTSDHGEAFGAHGEPSHGIFVYETTMRVPLVVAGPGVEAGRDETPVSLVDVAPTLLAWAGLDADDALQPSGRPLPGVGRPAGGSRDDDRPLYVESFLPHFTHGWHPLRGLVWQDHKYVEARTAELYDLAADPDETDDLAPSRPDRAQAMGGRLHSFLADHPPRDIGGEHAPDPESLRRLAALGYVLVERDGDPLDPDQPDPRDRVGELDVLQRALSELRRGRWLAGLDADSPPVTGDEGRARREQGLALLEEVRATLAGLVATNPDNPRYRGHLGFVELSLGNHEAAVAHFERVVADDFDPAITHFNLASALAGAGDLERARAEMEAVLSFDPTFAWAYDWLAAHHEGRGELGRAAWWRGEQLRRGRVPESARAAVTAQRDRLVEAARRAGQAVAGP